MLLRRGSFLWDLPVRDKLNAMVVSVGLIALVFASFVITTNQYISEKHEILNDISVHAEMIGASNVAPLLFDTPLAAAENLSALRSASRVRWAALYRNDRTLFATYSVEGFSRSNIPQFLPADNVSGQPGDLVVVKKLERDGLQVGYVALGGDPGQLYGQAARRVVVAFFVIVVAVLISLLIASRIQKIITDPLANLVSLMDHVTSTQDYSRRAEPGGKDELGRLVVGFNKMLEDISRRDTALRTEIADRLAVEENLRRSEEQYRTLFELAGDAIFIADADSGIIISANREAHDLMGYPYGELRGMHQSDLHPPEMREKYRKIFADHAFSGGVAHDVFVRTSHGNDIPVAISGSVVRVSGRRIVFGIFRDMTETQALISRLRHSEIEHRRAEQKYRSLFEFANDAIIVSDAETGIILETNRKADELLGVPPGGVLGKHQVSLHPAEREEEYRSLFERSVRSESGLFRDLLVRTTNGTIIPVTVSTSVMKLDERTVLLSIFRDITELQEMINRIRRSEDQYRRLVETIPHGIEEIDTNGVITYANEVYSSMLGYAPGELVGVPTWSLPPEPDEQSVVRESLKKLLVEQPQPTPFFGRNLCRDGRVIDVQVDWNYKRTDRGEIIGFISMLTDITEKLRVEKELKESEARFRAFAETTGDMIHLTDKEGRITYANPATERLLGCGLADVLGRHPVELIHPDDRAIIAQDVRSAVSKGITPAPREVRLRKADGSWLYMEVLAFPIEIPGQDFTAGAVLRDITWRREAERNLRFSRFAVDSTQDNVFWHGEDGKFWYVNDATCRSLGYTRDELVDLHVHDIDPNFPQEKWASHWQRVRREGPQVIETVHRRKDGSTFPVEVSINPLRYEDEEFHCSFARDITNRKEQERQLRESLARFQSIATATHDMIHLFDEDLRFVYANRATESVLGYTVEEFLRLSVADLLHPDEKDGLLGAIARELSGIRPAASIPLEIRLRRKDGGYVDTEINSFVLESGEGKIYVGGVLRDITERKQAEARLRWSEQRFKSLSKEFHGVLEAIQDPLLLLNRDLEVVWANKGALSSFPGKSSTGDGSLHCYALCQDRRGPCDECLVRKCFASGISEEGTERTPDGRSWDVRAFPVYHDGGTVKNVIKVMTDVTEKLRLQAEARTIEEQLAQTNKMAALGTLVSGIAHEINNPNNAILFHAPVLIDAWENALRLLNRYADEEGDFSLAGIPYSEMRTSIPEILRAIVESAGRIGSIVESLRDFARLEREQEPGAVDLNAAVRAAIRIVQNQIRHYTDKFEMLLSDEGLRVKGSLQKLEQVIINLMLNALQSLDRRSAAITISTRLRSDEGTAELVVSDEGAGIDSDTLQRITEPFFTTKHDTGGMGLGLSISYSIVERYGGTMRFSSEPGKGTTVIVSLPVVETRQASS